MSVAAYARVSSTDQSLDIQIEQLRAAGAEKMFAEKRSGTTTEGRDQLAEALDWVREGDVLMVTRLDRLARSLSDLLAVVELLRRKGVTLKATEQPIDTGSPAGKAFLQMLGVFAEFETAIRKERQREGIEKAKAAGVYKRERDIDVAEVRRLRTEEGMTARQIAKHMKRGLSTVYRVGEGLWDKPPAMIATPGKPKKKVKSTYRASKTPAVAPVVIVNSGDGYTTPPASPHSSAPIPEPEPPPLPKAGDWWALLRGQR